VRLDARRSLELAGFRILGNILGGRACGYEQPPQPRRCRVRGADQRGSGSRCGMYEIYAGIMPTCASCLDGHHSECPDLMWSDTFGLYACGCEEC
jgi:hypothetical protein